MDDIRILAPGVLKPDPIYAARPLKWFKGRHVKKSFPAGDGSNRAEHMWIRITGYKGSQLVGVLDSDPTLCNLTPGGKVILRRDEILMVHHSENEWLAELDALLKKDSYTNEFLGEPTVENGLLDLYRMGLFSPTFALTSWRDFDGSTRPLANITRWQ